MVSIVILLFFILFTVIKLLEMNPALSTPEK